MRDETGNMSCLVEAAVQFEISTNVFLYYIDLVRKIAIMILDHFMLNLFDEEVVASEDN